MTRPASHRKSDPYAVWATPTDTPRTACGPFRDAVTFDKLASNVSSYDYCAEWQHSEVSKCLSCIRPEEKHVLNNCTPPPPPSLPTPPPLTHPVFTVLNAACAQQPLPGKTIGIEGNVFSSDDVNMTDASAVPTLDPSYFDEGAFGLGAKVGVALGALGFVLAVAGFLVVCLGKRRRRAYLRQMENSPAMKKGWAGHARGPPSETPLSQKPLRGGWDDSPVSAATEKGAFPGRYFSPYSSQFSSPVSAVDAPAMQWPDLSPRDREIGVALGGESPRPGPPEPVKGKGRAWDGVEVRGGEAGPSEPPVLGHPGYGRGSGSPPRRYTLTEEDARNGDAI